MRGLWLPSRLRPYQGYHHPSGATPHVPPDPDPVTPVGDALYVSLAGSDAPGVTGSISDPFRTLTKATDVVTGGQTIYLRDGTYSTPGTDCYYSSFGGLSSERAGDLDLRGKATAGNPITIRSYPGELAIISGENHSWHPRSYGDLNDVESPYLMRLIGEHLVLSHITFKKGVGKGVVLVGNHCTIRNFHTHSHHSDGLYIQGESNLIESFDGHHNYAIQNGGNTGDAIKFVDYGSQSAAFFGSGARTRNITISKARAWLNSDDGIDTWTAPGSIVEDCAAFNNGYGPTGNGQGYKFGQSGLRNSGNIMRRSISVRNSGNNFTTNDSTGATFERCTSYNPRGDVGMDFRSSGQDGSNGQNTGRDNISFVANYLRSPASASSLVVYQNNTWTLSITDPLFTSVVGSSADFLTLTSASPCRNAGASGDDLGAIPYGDAFAVPLTDCDASWDGAVPSAYTGSDAYPVW